MMEGVHVRSRYLKRESKKKSMDNVHAHNFLLCEYSVYVICSCYYEEHCSFIHFAFIFFSFSLGETDVFQLFSQLVAFFIESAFYSISAAHFLCADRIDFYIFSNTFRTLILVGNDIHIILSNIL